MFTNSPNQANKLKRYGPIVKTQHEHSAKKTGRLLLSVHGQASLSSSDVYKAEESHLGHVLSIVRNILIGRGNHTYGLGEAGLDNRQRVSFSMQSQFDRYIG